MDREEEELVAVRARAGAHDPEPLAMVDDVDRTLIRAVLTRDPWERVSPTRPRRASRS